MPYSVSTAAIRKKTHIATDDNPYEDEEVDSSPEDDDDVTKDAMIKVKPGGVQYLKILISKMCVLGEKETN